MKTQNVTPVGSAGVNLRRDKAMGQVWRRAGVPRKVADIDALPFAWFSPLGDGRRLCLLTGGDNTLYCRIDRKPRPDDMVAPDDYPGDGGYIRGDLRRVAPLPAAPILALTGTPGVVRLLLDHQPDQYLTYDGDLSLTFHGAMPELPEIKVVASEFNTLYGQVGAVGLTSTSTGASGSQLSQADNARLSAALVSAYEALKMRARGMDYCVQPVMARYRLLDAAGNTVAVGPTVAVCDPGGFSATGSILQSSADGMKTLGGGTIEMKVYRPAVVVPESLPAPWNRLVAKLVVEMTGEVEPLQRDAGVPHGIHRDNASGVVAVTSRLPGFAYGTVIDRQRLSYLAMQALSDGMYVAADFNAPFDGGIGAPAGTVKTFSGTGLNRLSPMAGAGEILPSIGRTYSAAAVAGDVTVLCNPLYKDFDGWSPGCFITSRDTSGAGAWRLAFSVRLSTPAGDVTVMRETVGEGNPPGSLSPVLMFPSGDAVSLTVSYLSPSGQAYCREFPLTVIPGGNIAAYVSPGLERIIIVDPAAVAVNYAPAGSSRGLNLEEGVAEFHSTSDLGRLLDRRRVSGGRINCVKVNPRSGSGWDFSRCKLLFFGEDGTGIVTLDAAGRCHSSAPVDNRPVRLAGAVCVATGGSGASILAIAGDDIIEISGQRVRTVLPSLTLRSSRFPSGPQYPPVAVGWNDRYKETWIQCSDGSLYRLTSGGELVRADLPGITLTMTGSIRFADSDGELLLGCAGGTFNLSDEQRVDSLEVELHERFHVGSAPGFITVNLFSSSVSGEVFLLGDRGTEIAERLLRLRISGEVNAPLTVRLAAPRRGWLEVVYRLAVAPDLAIHPPVFSSSVRSVFSRSSKL